MDATADVAKDARLIKRYANRKLYDTTDSRYVTLQQIAEFVRNGEDVRIIDNKSKEDLTNVTLAQIIYEEEKKGDSATRRTSLRSFIQEGRAKLMETLPAPISKLLREEEEGEEPRPTLLEEIRGLADERIKSILGGAMAHVHQLQSEVERLQGRIEELEGRLGIKGRKRDADRKREEQN